MKKPFPPAYDTGPRQGKTTAARKNLRAAPKLQVYGGRWGCVKAGEKDQGSGQRKREQEGQIAGNAQAGGVC
jgi:hypothetical protein